MAALLIVETPTCVHSTSIIAAKGTRSHIIVASPILFLLFFFTSSKKSKSFALFLYSWFGFCGENKGESERWDFVEIIFRQAFVIKLWSMQLSSNNWYLIYNKQENGSLPTMHQLNCHIQTKKNKLLNLVIRSHFQVTKRMN